ncbi:Bug family tripartite tricarboxylate transporter substrate binding protein [Roseibium sp.]|uniref:Bug family tripartite tricarboxylate transporter substrate binding protein n=1 Tax=Roseibium sp. TaxID=1936156 RepID=UPI003A97F582
MIIKRILAAAVAASALFGASASAETPEEFYKGKTIRVMSTTGAGGTMDLYLLLFMKYAKNHFPEGSSLVLEHRTGGGGAVGANHLFNAAPKDGTYFGMPVPSLAAAKFATPDQIRYEPNEFSMLGRLVDLPRVYVARAVSGLETLQDAAKGGEFTHGIMTLGTSLDQYMTVANEALGTNFRRVAGYTGGGPTFLAMEQGEVQSTTAEPANLLANKWHLVEAGEINVLGYLGLEPIKGLEEAPNLLDMIDESNPSYARAKAVAQSAAIGLSLIAPPGVPEDRIEYLRKVFAATLTDPALVAEAQERKIPVNFSDGTAMQEILAGAANVDESVQAWFRDIRKPK